MTAVDAGTLQKKCLWYSERLGRISSVYSVWCHFSNCTTSTGLQSLFPKQVGLEESSTFCHCNDWSVNLEVIWNNYWQTFDFFAFVSLKPADLVPFVHSKKSDNHGCERTLISVSHRYLPFYYVYPRCDLWVNLESWVWR